MRTFIVHFLAQRTLEAHTDQFPDWVSLSVMAANHSPRIFLSWSDVEGIILRTMSSGGVNPHLHPQIAIDKLKEKIQAIKVEPTAKRSDALKTFQAIVNGEDNNGFSVGLHCEIMLGTLGLEDCYKDALRNGDKEPEKICEVRRLALTGLYSTYNTSTGNWSEFERDFSIEALLSCLLGIFQALERRCTYKPYTLRMSPESLSSRIAILDTYENCRNNGRTVPTRFAEWTSGPGNLNDGHHTSTKQRDAPPQDRQLQLFSETI